MEILLLVCLLVILIYIKMSFDSRFDDLEDRFKHVSRLLESLKKSTSTSESVVNKVVASNKIEPEMKSVEETVYEITPFPAFSQTVNVPEKVVFNEDKTVSKPEYSKPKPIIEKKSWFETFKEKNPDLEKFIGENLINKLGILILVLGISYFVKYSIDKGWIGEPARVGIGVLCGAMIMGIAHKLRQGFAAFSSVFMAGAIAVFYFTISIAFHDYHLINQTIAFVIMTIITAFSCLISISFNRKELAVLSLIGGFAVPFMVSTGSGNYVVLFTYIAILNLGILALAYFKKWQIINILSYLFTIILYGGWLFKELEIAKPHYFGAFVFAFIFYIIFILINIINNLQTKGLFSTIELSILASNTFLFYGAGMLIFKDYHHELSGLFTTVLGLLNFLYAWFLYKKFGLDKTAVYLLIGLTLTFITLAIPIQFEGNQITAFWAAEAVLLFWLSQKSSIISYRFGSAVVTFLMLVSLIMDWNNVYSSSAVFPIVFNKIFITGLFSTISLFLISFLLKNETEDLEQFGIVFNPTKYRNFISIIAVLICYFVGILEVNFQSNVYFESLDSAISIPICFHLVFCAFLFFILNKSSVYKKMQTASIIGIINIFLFAFWFSNYPFYEYQNYIYTGKIQHLAFYLHYNNLGIVIYFMAQIYINHKKMELFEALKSSKIVWVTAFLIIYIASSELILHSLWLITQPINVNNPNLDAYMLIDAAREKIYKTGLPILWGVLAFVFLIIGIKKQFKTLRIIALTLLGLTIVKLFLYDISNASETGKIIAFILLGVLILIISFVYQKLKVLVLDDSNNSKTNENE
jgi:uncharacterized membrane protein